MRDLKFGHLGNGLTVYDINDYDNDTNDYRTIAHIDKLRGINYRGIQITKDEEVQIENVAYFSDSEAFDNKPVNVYIITGKLVNGRRFNPITTTTPQHYNIYSGTLWLLCRDRKRKLIKRY